MPLDAPFMLGPFTIAESGRLIPTTEGRFPAFSIRWRGHPVDVFMERLQGPVGSLAISTRVGFVGSTADDKPSLSQPKREQVFAILRGLTDLLPDEWRLELAADHQIRLTARLALEMPASAAGLLSAVTMVLLQGAPYLDMLAEAGVRSGTAKT